MFADPKKVRARRLRRRLKAGASIALALVAGAFLACKGGGDPQGQQDASPTGPGPDASRDRDSGVAPTDAAPADIDASIDASSDDAGRADASTALVVRDGGADAGAARAPRVDKREHRKGMPVRDNLLE